MLERTIKCPICGKSYKVYAHYAGDQSACPDCVRKAEENRPEWKPWRLPDYPESKRLLMCAG